MKQNETCSFPDDKDNQKTIERTMILDIGIVHHYQCSL